MKNWLLCILVISGCFTSPVSNAKPQQTPPVVVLDGSVLRKSKAAIQAKEPSVLPAYKKLLKDADKALLQEPVSVMEKKHLPPSGDKHDYMSLAPYHWPDPSKPDGLPYMRKDGQTNPEVKDYKDKEYMPRLCEQIYTLALAYYFSGDEKYAAHATRLIETWFLHPATKMNPNLNFAQAIKGQNTGRGAGMIDARHFVKVIDGIGLLRNSGVWSKKNQEGMKNWFGEFLNWMETSPNGIDESDAPNNHGTYYDVLRTAIAMFTGDKEHAKKVVANALQRLDQQMDEEGKFPKEMVRTIALHYNTFNLNAFYSLASMAEKLGIDIWHHTTASGATLQKSFNFLYPFLTREKEWTGQQIKPFEFEDGYPVLLISEKKYKCKTCRDAVRKLAGEDAEKRRELLLY